MDSLKNLTSGFNPLSFLGAGAANGANPLEGADPLAMLSSLFGNQAAIAQNAQPQGDVCSCGAGASQGGACGCGCSCCQKNDSLGF